MPGPTLTAAELAAELGRSESWLYDHWQTETRERRMPAPLHGGKPPLTWSRAHIVAWLDKPLNREERIAAAAFRAAAAAAAGTPLVDQETLAEAEHRARLNERFASPGGRLRAAQSPGDN